MPAHDRVGLHDDQGRSPILPRLGEQDPEQSIARAEVRTPDRAPENGQLLTQRQVLERDGSVSRTEQPECSKENDKRGQHALSCRPIDLRLNRRGWRQVLATHRLIVMTGLLAADSAITFLHGQSSEPGRFSQEPPQISTVWLLRQA